jgi:phosphoribosyl-ATP pyrophosphohydrolase
VTEIAQLSRKLHGSVHGADEYTFRSLAEHVEEVRGLLAAGDGHWKAEAVDIIIHAQVLLRRHGVSEGEIAELFVKRGGRFKEKISASLKEKKRG